MKNNFDAALSDLGFPPFGEHNGLAFDLERNNKTVIAVQLFRDQQKDSLRISAFTSNIVPFSISRQFLGQLARAALEPFRDGIGVGMHADSEQLCVYYNLPVTDYIAGSSSLVLEKIIEQVELWDDLLPHAAG